jgi:hypothetical protein
VVTVVSRFRLFGRPDTDAPPDAPQVPSQRQAPPSRPRPAPNGPPPIGSGAPWPTGRPSWSWATDDVSHTGPQARGTSRPRPVATGPATQAARPAGPLTSQDPRVIGDPPTDPYGFPPIPACTLAAPDPAEAAALAGAFAVDYLSWDEDDPDRRGRVLVEYLSTPGRDPARLGWPGKGRQRAEFALPGLVRPEGDGRVLVDVRVRVTPYRAVGDHGAGDDAPNADADARAETQGVAAAAPAPTGRGWRGLASTWIRLSVPVTLDGGRLVIDAWDETLGEEPPAPIRAVPKDDHTLLDDDPVHDSWR